MCGPAPNYSQWCHRLCHLPVSSGHNHDCWSPSTEAAFHGMRSALETPRATIPTPMTAVHPYNSSSCPNRSDFNCQSLGACYGPCFTNMWPWSHGRGFTINQGFSWVKHQLLNTLSCRAAANSISQGLESGSNNAPSPVATTFSVHANQSPFFAQSPHGEALQDDRMPPESVFAVSPSGSVTEDLMQVSPSWYTSPAFCATPLYPPSPQDEELLATALPQVVDNPGEVEKGIPNVLDFGDPHSSKDSPSGGGGDTESSSLEDPTTLGSDILSGWLPADSDVASANQSELVSPIAMSTPSNSLDYADSGRSGVSRRSSSTDGTLPYPSGCTFPGCSSKVLFTRRCDLTKHYKQHLRQFFCRVEGCRMSEAASKSTSGDKRPVGFSTKKDRIRHEKMHNPSIICEHCRKVFSREDNLRDHVHRLHNGASV